MTTKLTKAEAVNRYKAILSEIRSRIDAIDHCMNKKTGLDRPLEWEICFLQLRKICELIALGCLVAHGDIPDVHGKTLSKAWHPKTIIDELQQLRPKFFPIAAEYKGTSNGIKAFGPVRSKHLTKEQLLDIYGKAGDALHSGNLRAIARPRAITMDFAQLEEWTQSIIDLMRVHFIFSADSEAGLICVLKDAKGMVFVSPFGGKHLTPLPTYVVHREDGS